MALSDDVKEAFLGFEDVSVDGGASAVAAHVPGVLEEYSGGVRALWRGVRGVRGVACIYGICLLRPTL